MSKNYIKYYMARSKFYNVKNKKNIYYYLLCFKCEYNLIRTYLSWIITVSLKLILFTKILKCNIF